MSIEKTMMGAASTPAATPVAAGLRVSLAGNAGKTFPILKTPLLIGRTGGEITIPHATVSSRHAVIDSTAAGFVITDQGSTNGTFVNGQRISTPTPIQNLDEVKFGDEGFIFTVVEDRYGVHAEAPPQPSTNQTMLIASAPNVAQIPAGQTILLHAETGGLDAVFQLSLRITTVGRSEGDLNVNDQTLSRKHFQIEVHPDFFAVKDLGSANGTHLNGKPLSYTKVAPNDVFTAGRSRFRLEKR